MGSIVESLFKVFVLLFLISSILTSFFGGSQVPPRETGTEPVSATSPDQLPRPLTGPPDAGAPTPSSPASPEVEIPPELPPVDQKEPILKAVHEDIYFEIQGAEAQGSIMQLRLTALNNGPDRMIELSSLPWTKTLIYDEVGNTHRASKIRVGNIESTSQTRAMLISGVPTPVVLTYEALPTVRGKTQTAKIKLFELHANLFDAIQARRNSFGNPVAAFHATFRNFDVTQQESQ